MLLVPGPSQPAVNLLWGHFGLRRLRCLRRRPNCLVAWRLAPVRGGRSRAAPGIPSGSSLGLSLTRLVLVGFPLAPPGGDAPLLWPSRLVASIRTAEPCIRSLSFNQQNTYHVPQVCKSPRRLPRDSDRGHDTRQASRKRATIDGMT